MPWERWTGTPCRHAGLLDGEHVRTIQTFVRDLPEHVPPGAVEKAEVFLAEKATELRPDQLRKVADRLTVTLNPGDQSPTVTGELGQDVIDRDARGHAQRRHDALSALARGQLGDPALGRHNGLPVTIIATATLDQLQAGAGHAVTAGGTLLPVGDIIRMASHAYLYLAIFDFAHRVPVVPGPDAANRVRGLADSSARQGSRLYGAGVQCPRLPVPTRPESCGTAWRLPTTTTITARHRRKAAEEDQDRDHR